MITMHSRYRMLFFFLSILTVGLLLYSCDKSGEGSPINNNEWVQMGSQEGMIGGSESISFSYHYEEHTEFLSAGWKTYVYTWDGVEIDSVLEHMNSFKESDSPVGQRGMNVLSVYHFEDRVFNEGSFREGGSLFYIFDSRLDYSVDTNPSSACRLEPDSSYVRKDTAFVFFTEKIHRFEYNEELYNPDGVYMVFKLLEKERERLGWLKLSTTGSAVSVSACAIQK